MNPFLIEDELKMKSHIFHIFIQAPVFIILILFIILFFYFVSYISPAVHKNMLC